MTINDIAPELLEKYKVMIQELGEAIIKAYKPILEKLQNFFDSLEPYQKFEMLHPRKKPRGSLRRLRKKQRKEQNERLF